MEDYLNDLSIFKIYANNDFLPKAVKFYLNKNVPCKLGFEIQNLFVLATKKMTI